MLYDIRINNNNNLALMNVDHPEYVWHGPSERILSIDFHPFINEIITGGSDECISSQASEFDGYAKAWDYKVTSQNKIQINFKFGLKKHSNNVSAVKYSPNARYVATGSDDHSIVVWEMRQSFPFMGSKEKKLMWSPRFELRGHSAEVSDVKWSPDNKYIISAGFDKRVIIWLVQKSQYVKILDEHKKCIQGLAVDPMFKYILSAGADRMVKIWKNSESKKDDCAFYRHSTIQKLETLEQPQNKNSQGKSSKSNIASTNEVQIQQHNLAQKQQQQKNNMNGITLNSIDQNNTIIPSIKHQNNNVVTLENSDVQNVNNQNQQIKPSPMQKEKQTQIRHRLFYDENVPTFYRRPDISPDGELFLIPSGQWKNQQGDFIHCAFLYRRRNCERPSFIIPTNQQASVCARFCPKLFKKNNPEGGMLMQPYYMVFAVGTFNSILVYNTDNFDLLYAYGNHHYASITQIAWKDDRLLAVSSNDRTCSFMVFAEGQLGAGYQITDPALKQIVTRRPYEPEEVKTKIKTTDQDKRNISTQEGNVQQPESINTTGVSPIKPAVGGKKRIVPCMIQKFD